MRSIRASRAYARVRTAAGKRDLYSNSNLSIKGSGVKVADATARAAGGLQSDAEYGII